MLSDSTITLSCSAQGMLRVGVHAAPSGDWHTDRITYTLAPQLYPQAVLTALARLAPLKAARVLQTATQQHRSRSGGKHSSC
ncbi:hypothetical protein GCM10008957_49160 [Deinococcus ruber]|uniref:Uncharacterized protein n=1 Tax=Deinococcus ruber TaxID=1848197 RepID=A0A918CMX0_9DEIO|nr:hypothetical protein GCM10008957_49160 [Deinococcus ruber]